MRTIKIFSLVLLFSFLLLFVPRMGFAEDAPDQGTEEKCCSWTAGKTSVSDLPPEERKKLYGLKLPEGYWEWWNTFEKLEVPKGVTYPTRFDWRDSGGVTPARDQGQCGSCWDFCAFSALEAQVKIYGEVEMDLSEQQVLSCTTYGEGCDGGYPEEAYRYIINHGSVSEQCMPYKADHWVPCDYDTCEIWARMSHWTAICQNPNVDAIKNAIYNYGPVSSLMAAPDTFQSYQGGCFDYTYFGLNHCVLLVGWDDTLCHGEGAWIGKNSWGKNWGMDGFFYIKRGVCQIGTGVDLPNYVFHRPYVRLEDYGVNDEAGGNGNGTPEPGETVRLDFTLKNVWSPLGEVEVTVAADTEGIVITDDSSYLGDMGSQEIKDNSTDPMEFYVPEDFPVRRVYFTFHVEGDSGGGVTYTADTTVEIWVGKIEILLVDDDQGVDISSNYEDYYLDALDSLKAVYQVWDKKEEPDTFYNFSEYKILIWFTGDHRDSIFSDTDIESLMTFLDNEGRLFLTSQDAVEVLSSGDALRQQFLEDYLHVGYDGNTDKPLVEGYPGDEVGDTLWIKPWAAGGNQISKDILVPDSQADTVLVYAEINWTPTDLVAGTKFRNDYFRVVSFGFGFEALSGGIHMGHQLSAPHFVMGRVLDWLNIRPTITVMSPNGGQNWCAGSTQLITWDGVEVTDVRIEYSTNGGADWDTIVSSTPNDGEYSWEIPSYLPTSTTCRVKILDLDSDPSDISDGDFTITGKSLSLVSPNGGEVYIVDSTYNIAWTDSCVGNVSLEYSINGGADWDTIVSTTPSGESYSWLVPDIFTASAICLVRICDADDGISCDTSDTFFFILNYVPGDASDDDVVNIGDVVYLTTYLFQKGPPPVPMAAGDVNGEADCEVNIGDVVYLVTYLFQGGPPPLPGCAE